LIFCALFAGVAGMLWETNDLIGENQDHPVISPELHLTHAGFDPYGDPYARPGRAKPLPVGNVLTSPVTQLSFAFVITMIIGSLFRSLISGSFALVALIAVVVLLVGRENVIEFFQNQDSRSFVDSTGQWIADHTENVKQFLWNSLPSAFVAVTGLVMGLMK
jgi:hypothetical protein